jgi:hypothetical protein
MTSERKTMYSCGLYRPQGYPDPVVSCGAYRPGHDPHRIPATYWCRPGEIRIPGTARMVGEVIEFTPADGGDPVMLRNHDPALLTAFIDGGFDAEYAPRWGILRFGNKVIEHHDDHDLVATTTLSVTTDQLSPCGSLAPPDASLAERIMADGGALEPIEGPEPDPGVSERRHDGDT